MFARACSAAAHCTCRRLRPHTPAMLLLLLAALSFGSVSSELTMMLVWGQPTSLKNADVNSSLTWDQCLRTCYDSQSCIMAWQNGSSCYNFDYDSTGSVLQTTSENGSIVAYKVENPSGQCPVGINPPTFNNTNATGSLLIDADPDYFPMWVYYTIYFTGTGWQVKNSYNISCMGFSNIVQHSDGTATCVFTWYTSDIVGFNYNDGLRHCTNVSSHMTSLNYPEDVAYWESEGQSLRPLLKNSNTYARIDGKRTAACQTTPNTTECMSVEGFTFTGTPADDFDNYDWVTDPSAQATANDNCLVMVFNGSGTVKTDVRSCETDSPLQAGLVFCSVPAWKYALL